MSIPGLAAEAAAVNGPQQRSEAERGAIGQSEPPARVERRGDESGGHGGPPSNGHGWPTRASARPESAVRPWAAEPTRDPSPPMSPRYNLHEATDGRVQNRGGEEARGTGAAGGEGARGQHRRRRAGRASV